MLFGMIALLFSACSNSPPKPAAETTEVTEKSNDPVMITVGSFESKAADLVGETVTIKGTADHICKHDGKKAFPD